MFIIQLKNKKRQTWEFLNCSFLSGGGGGSKNCPPNVTKCSQLF